LLTARPRGWGDVVSAIGFGLVLGFGILFIAGNRPQRGDRR
jgi:hypothetical protein